MLSAEKELFYTTVLCNLARGDVTERPKKITEKTDWWTVVWSDNVSDRWFRVSCGHSLPKYIYSKAWCPICSMQIQHFVFLHLTNVKDNKYDSTTGDWLKAIHDCQGTVTITTESIVKWGQQHCLIWIYLDT